jgi:hypothetical protein
LALVLLILRPTAAPVQDLFKCRLLMQIEIVHRDRSVVD